MTAFDEGILTAHREDVDILNAMDRECDSLRTSMRLQGKRMTLYAALTFWIGFGSGFLIHLLTTPR